VVANVMQPISSRLFRALRICRDGIQFQFGAFDPKKLKNPKIPDKPLVVEAKVWILDEAKGPEVLQAIAENAQLATFAPPQPALVQQMEEADKSTLEHAAVDRSWGTKELTAPVHDGRIDGKVVGRSQVPLRRAQSPLTSREASTWARIVPPYRLEEIPPRPVTPTHLETITWKWADIWPTVTTLPAGTDVVLDFRNGPEGKTDADPKTNLCVVRVGNDYLLPLRRNDEIQAAILAGLNKPHQNFLFLNFGGEDQPAATRDRARRWLQEQADRVATTRQVTDFKDARKAGEGAGTLKAVWSSLSLTYHGLCTLMRDEDRNHVGLEAFEAFRQGPVGRLAADNGKSDPDRWVVGGPKRPSVDAVVTVAADDPEELLVALDEQRLSAARHGLVVLMEQRGDALPGSDGGREHFGYRDSVSQPGIKDYTPPTDDDPPDDAAHPGSGIVPASQFVLGRQEPGELPAAPQEPAWMHDGSFQVFRRLAQDVPGWWKQLANLAEQHPRVGADRLGASLIGRWPNGNPLSLAAAAYERTPTGELNDFDYLDDPKGHVTPRFAHVRKMRPRDGADRAPRILRRGIPFGPVFDPAAGPGHGVDTERGLLFNAFMARIEQFEQLQNGAQAAGAEPRDNDGPDPLVGLGDDGGHCKLDGVELDLQPVVQTTGTVYAFAPSLSTLKTFASGGELGR
jgi:Dyp-type peroxidase family